MSPRNNGQATLALGTISTAIDAAVRINGTTTITATGATTGFNGILGASGGAGAINFAPSGYATVGLDDFAALSTGNIVAGSAVAGFYQNTYGNNFDMTSNTTPGKWSRAASGYGSSLQHARRHDAYRWDGNLITYTAALITPNMGANNASLTGRSVANYSHYRSRTARNRERSGKTIRSVFTASRSHRRWA
jgi:hypothetical protein